MPHRSDSARLETDVDKIVSILRRYGVLPLQRVATIARADGVHEGSPFRRALSRAVALKRVRCIGVDLYEAAEDPAA